MERVGTLALACPSCAVPTPGSPRSMGHRGPAPGGGGRVWPPGGSSFPATRNMAALRPGCAARCGEGRCGPTAASGTGSGVPTWPRSHIPGSPHPCVLRSLRAQVSVSQHAPVPALHVPRTLCPQVPVSPHPFVLMCPGPFVPTFPISPRGPGPSPSPGLCRQRWLPVLGMRSRSGPGGVPALRWQQEAPRAERPPPSPGRIKAAARCGAGARGGGMSRCALRLLLCCAAALLAADTAHGHDAGSGTEISPSPSSSATATSLGTPDVSSSGSDAGTAHASPTSKAAASTTPPPNPSTTVSPSSTPASTVLKASFSDTAATSVPAAPTSSSDTDTASSPSGITGSPGPLTSPSDTTTAPSPSRTPGSVEATSPSQPAVPSSEATGHPPSSTAASAPSSPGSSKPPPAPSSPTVSPGPSSTVATSTRMAPAIGTSAVVGSCAQPPTKPSPAVVAIICLFICLLVGGAAVLLVWLSRRRNPRFQHLDEVPMSNPGVPPAAE
ncbi:putative LOC729966 homolog [Amazona ochrocephala]